MPTYRFEKVQLTAKKSGKCACGKRVTRQQTFYQTHNPFNTNADGQVKTVGEIMAENRAKADAWQREPVECSNCEAQAVSR